MKYTCIVLLLLFSVNLQAQESNEIVKSFDSLVLNSNNWTEYRVIKKRGLSSFKDELISTSNNFDETVKSLNANISNLESTLSSVDNENKALKAELSEMKLAKDEMNLLGITLSKANYTVMVWVIIFILILILAFVTIKLRNRTIVTDEIKENLDNTTKEFEEYKHRAIEKQQKLGRELLDTQKQVQAKSQNK
jgi:predicted nuclease with TOPRIM domain